MSVFSNRPGSIPRAAARFFTRLSAAWALSRVLGSIPITPGGVGFVELGLTGALVAFGASNAEAVAATLGASTWQTFWRITLPAIRWGLTYGVVLTVARALGEFGAVIMVSTGLPGGGQTLTLLVNARYVNDRNLFGAYCAATLLMGMALVTLFLMIVLERKRDTAK